MKAPYATTKSITNSYSTPGQRVIEFGNTKGGGLISLVSKEDGTLILYIYQCDENVILLENAALKMQTENYEIYRTLRK